MRDALAEHLGGQADDVWGLALIVLGALIGLGELGLTGPFGSATTWATSMAFGRFSWIVPLGLVAVGLVLVLDHGRSAIMRICLGVGVVHVALTGLAHLGTGPRQWPDDIDRLRPIGGVVGAAVAHPLRVGVGKWGGGVLLIVLLFFGLLLVCGLRVRDAVTGAVTGVVSFGRGVRRHGGRALGSMFTLSSDEGARTRHPTSVRNPRGRSVGDAGDAELVPRVALDPSGRRPAASKRRNGVYDGEAAGVLGGAAAELKTPTQAFDAATPVGVDESVAAPVSAVDPEVAAASTTARTHRSVEVRVPPVPEWNDEQGRAEQPTLPGVVDPAAADAPPPWKLPPLALLKKGKSPEIDKRAVEVLGRTLEEALAAHGVETRLVGMTVGPTVTRYELELAPGVKVSRVTTLAKDIAYAMAAADVRILAPIPGRSAIGVEVPNRQRQLVAVGDILASDEARSDDKPLTVALGRDIEGKPVLVDLAKMPHVLVAGTTGSGKSSCINSLLTSLLVRARPEEVRLILIDPKMVEMSQYNGLPHLLTQVVTNPKKAAAALDWAVQEMERRYDLLATLGFRDIGGYNEAVVKGTIRHPYDTDAAKGIDLPPVPNYEAMSYIVVVVDELADLMMVAAKEVEDSIVRIAQKARAVGIHLVIATQRPSVNVITGLIKANVPSRFAFAVSTMIDSRVILDQPGAEKLIGQGDMLMITVSSNISRRVQGAFVTEDEVRNVVSHWRRQAEGRPRRIARPSGGSAQPEMPVAKPYQVADITPRAVGAGGFLGSPASSPSVGTTSVPAALGAGGSPAVNAPSARFAAGGTGMPASDGTVVDLRRDAAAGRETAQDDRTDEFRRDGAAPGDPSVAGVRSLDGSGRVSLMPDLAGLDAALATATLVADDGDGDEMYEAAMELVVRSQLGSTSMLQRKLKVGFSRAGRLMDLMEDRGVVGPSTGSKARDVLLSVEDYERRKRGG